MIKVILEQRESTIDEYGAHTLGPRIILEFSEVFIKPEGVYCYPDGFPKGLFENTRRQFIPMHRIFEVILDGDSGSKVDTTNQ